jgi:integrase
MSARRRVESSSTSKRAGTAKTAPPRHQEASPDARPTIQPLAGFDPVRDKRYRQALIARDVTDWLAWLELGGAAPRTLDQYERDLARLCLMYPDKQLAEVGDGDVAHCLRTFSPKQRRVRGAALQSFFRWAVRTRRLERNPMDLLPAIKRQPQPVIDVFTDAEVEALLSLPLVDATPLAVLLEAGLRKAEARHLQVKHCAPEAGRLIVREGKGRKERVVPMSERLSRHLAELILLEGLENDDHVFYGVKANALSRNLLRRTPIGEGTFHRWWGRCLEDAGVRYRNPHTARHTFATAWRRRGLSVDELQILLGHASIATTSDLYVHIEVEDVARHMAAIEAEK